MHLLYSLIVIIHVVKVIITSGLSFGLNFLFLSFTCMSHTEVHVYITLDAEYTDGVMLCTMMYYYTHHTAHGRFYDELIVLQAVRELRANIEESHNEWLKVKWKDIINIASLKVLSKLNLEQVMLENSKNVCCVCACVRACVSVCLCASVCVCVCVSVCLSVCLSVACIFSVCISVCTRVCMYVCLYACVVCVILSIHASVYTDTCVHICIHIYTHGTLNNICRYKGILALSCKYACAIL